MIHPYSGTLHCSTKECDFDRKQYYSTLVSKQKVIFILILLSKTLCIPVWGKKAKMDNVKMLTVITTGKYSYRERI